MKKILTSVCMSLALSASVAATELTNIVVGPPGGTVDLLSLPLGKYLNDKKGWEVTQKRFVDCKGLSAYLKNNPNDPVVITMWYDDAILAELQPDHPRVCPDVKLEQDTVVTIASTLYHNICTINNESFQDLKNMENPRIVSWNHPVQVMIVEDMVRDLQLKNPKVIYLKSAKELYGAVKSGDVDFMIGSTPSAFADLNGKCFFTMAPSAEAAKLSDLKGGTRISIEDVVSTPTRIGTGLQPVYVAYNVDIDKLRNDIVDILKTEPEYLKMYTVQAPAGLVVGLTPEQQWQQLQTYTEGLKASKAVQK